MRAPGILSKLDKSAAVVPGEARLADDDVADHDCVAVRWSRHRFINQAHLAVLRIGDEVVKQFRVVAARFEVLTVGRIMNVTILQRRLISAEVQVVAEPVIERRAVAGDLAGIDQQVIGIARQPPSFREGNGRLRTSAR